MSIPPQPGRASHVRGQSLDTAGTDTDAGASIDSLLRRAAERHGSHPALVFGDRELSYAELEAASDRLAARLRAAADGELAGARVGVVAGNEPCLPIALFAAWRLGAVAVPLSARLREQELRSIFADAEVSLLISVREASGYSFAELLPRLLPELPSVRACLLTTSTGEVEEELTASPREEPELLGDDVAALLYTSGTTGAPKGVLVTHARELAGAGALGTAIELSDEDTLAFVIPISHAFGLTCFLSAVAAGATVALVESTLSPGPLLAVLEERRATILHGPPVLFAGLLKARPEGLPNVRTGFVGGASSAPELLERLESAGNQILNLYGLTETGAVACCAPSDPPHVRHTTVGRPLRGVELRLAQDDDGDTLGELQLRGEHVVPRYFHPTAATAAAVTDGWFRTGDLAELDDGCLRIVGRAKELVHVGGFNVFPSEVEAILLTHPDVAQAAVVGVPHEQMGEALQAFVVGRPGTSLSPAALLQFARPKIAGYKLPYAISILPELPLLPSGKPDRVALAGSARTAAGSRLRV